MSKSPLVLLRAAANGGEAELEALRASAPQVVTLFDDLPPAEGEWLSGIAPEKLAQIFSALATGLGADESDLGSEWYEPDEVQELRKIGEFFAALVAGLRGEELEALAAVLAEPRVGKELGMILETEPDVQAAIGAARGASRAEVAQLIERGIAPESFFRGTRMLGLMLSREAKRGALRGHTSLLLSAKGVALTEGGPILLPVQLLIEELGRAAELDPLRAGKVLEWLVVLAKSRPFCFPGWEVRTSSALGVTLGSTSEEITELTEAWSPAARLPAGDIVALIIDDDVEALRKKGPAINRGAVPFPWDPHSGFVTQSDRAAAWVTERQSQNKRPGVKVEVRVDVVSNIRADEARGIRAVFEDAIIEKHDNRLKLMNAAEFIKGRLQAHKADLTRVMYYSRDTAAVRKSLKLEQQGELWSSPVLSEAVSLIEAT